MDCFFSCCGPTVCKHWNIYFFCGLHRQEVCSEGSAMQYATCYCWAAEALSRRPTEPHPPAQCDEDPIQQLWVHTYEVARVLRF